MLFRKAVEQVGQFPFRQLVHELRSRDGLLRIHSHIQRSLQPEGKSPLGRVQLKTRDPQVREHPIGRRQVQLPDHVVYVREVCFHQSHPLLKVLQGFARYFQRVYVAIQPHQPPGSQLLGYFPSVTLPVRALRPDSCRPDPPAASSRPRPPSPACARRPLRSRARPDPRSSTRCLCACPRTARHSRSAQTPSCPSRKHRP